MCRGMGGAKEDRGAACLGWCEVGWVGQDEKQTKEDFLEEATC